MVGSGCMWGLIVVLRAAPSLPALKAFLCGPRAGWWGGMNECLVAGNDWDWG